MYLEMKDKPADITI